MNKQPLNHTRNYWQFVIPNFITALRLATTPLLAWTIAERRFVSALACIVFAGVTDWLDGFAARRLRVTGGAGVWFDPLADKVMLVVLFSALTWTGVAPLWLFILVMGRDLVIVAGALLLRIFAGVRSFLPSKLGKVSTFFQITYGLVAVLVNAFDPNALFSRILYGLALLLTALFTGWSGLDYIRLGIRLVPIDASKARE